MKPTWKRYLLYASLIIVGGGVIFILVETIRAKNTGFETKTLWDWMELLIIPFFLTGGAIALNLSEKKRERKLAEDRARLEREIATDRQQEAALQAYLDRMTELLLEKKLRTSDENDEVRNAARIRTLTVLRGLDAIRKGLVMLFLYEARVINKENTTVDLSGADMKGADLVFANLVGANLFGVDLSQAKLIGAYLDDANLDAVNLRCVDLRGAKLKRTIIDHALLEEADLTLANLQGAYLRGANLQKTNLEGVRLEDADLTLADLQGASLRGANLLNADLTNANLEGANLTNIIL
jgi:uncharacterized protein YjbI with pentapeptide repeats